MTLVATVAQIQYFDYTSYLKKENLLSEKKGGYAIRKSNNETEIMEKIAVEMGIDPKIPIALDLFVLSIQIVLL